MDSLREEVVVLSDAAPPVAAGAGGFDDSTMGNTTSVLVGLVFVNIVGGDELLVMSCSPGRGP